MKQDYERINSLQEDKPKKGDEGKTIYSPQWWGDHEIITVQECQIICKDMDGEIHSYDINEYDEFYWQKPILVSEDEHKADKALLDEAVSVVKDIHCLALSSSADKALLRVYYPLSAITIKAEQFLDKVSKLGTVNTDKEG